MLRRLERHASEDRAGSGTHQACVIALPERVPQANDDLHTEGGRREREQQECVVDDQGPLRRLRNGDRLLFGCGSRGLGVADLLILLLEPVDAAFGVDQLLLPCKERVAGGANFDADVALMSRARLERVPASADDVDFFVGGVNSSFHGKFQYTTSSRHTKPRQRLLRAAAGLCDRLSDSLRVEGAVPQEQRPRH